MFKPSFRARLNYRFDNLMARGNVAVIALLGIVSLAWVLLAGLIAWLFRLNPQGERYGFVEATWRQLTFTLDPGTFSGDTGWGWRLPSLLTTLFGVLVVASLIGVVSAAFDDRIAQLRKGRSSVLETDHTVILGWNAKVFTIVSELALANQSRVKPVVVVLADRDRVDMEDAIRERVPHSFNTRVVCRSGNPLDQDELLRANPFGARSIIVLGGSDSSEVDALSIKTALALTNHPNRPDRELNLVAEMLNPSRQAIGKLVGGDEVRWLLPVKVISKLTVQACRQPGLSIVYTELLDFANNEIYVTEQPALVGTSFLEAQLKFESSSVIGVSTGEGVILNPSPDRKILEGESLVVVAEDDSAIVLAHEQGVPNLGQITALNEIRRDPERTLILGSHSMLPLIVSELDEYSSPGSHITIMSDQPLPPFRDADSTNVAIHYADTTDIANLEAIEPESYDHILVLPYRDHLDVEAADSRTLVTLLELRELAARRGTNFNIVSEMLDDRNRKLAEVTRADDFIVSENIISLMMAQISETPALNEIYEVLFSSKGTEIYLRPAAWYVKPGEPANFFTVARAAAQRGETAIGYRDVTPEGVGDARAMVRLNPPRSEERVYGEGDLIIVLAED